MATTGHVFAGKTTTLALRGSTAHDNGVYHAPPEVLKAATDSTTGRLATEATVTASTAQDVWAIGVMAFESLQGRPALDHEGQAQACAIGADEYPWEGSHAAGGSQDTAAAWQRATRLRRIVQPCLARDPDARPAAGTLHRQIADFYAEQHTNGAGSTNGASSGTS